MNDNLACFSEWGDDNLIRFRVRKCGKEKAESNVIASHLINTMQNKFQKRTAHESNLRIIKALLKPV